MLLDELAKIVRCKKETELTILLIFYDVDPSYLRKQGRTFGQAFNNFAHDIEKVKKWRQALFAHDIEKVKMWRQALSDAANLSGWDHSSSKWYFHGKFISIDI